MGDTRLALIPTEEIPDRGGAYLIDREWRMRTFKNDAHTDVSLSLSFASIAVVSTALIDTAGPAWCIPLLVCAALLAGGAFCHYAAETIGNACAYFAHRKTPCFPDGNASVEYAEFENATRRAAMAYNRLAVCWNAGEDAGLEGLEKYRAYLEARHRTILKAIRRLEEGTRTKRLPASGDVPRLLSENAGPAD